MRKLFIIFLILVIILIGCKKLGFPSPIEGVDDSGQDVLDEDVSDIDRDLAAVEGDPSAEVQSAVSDEDLQDMNQSLQEMNDLESDTDP